MSLMVLLMLAMCGAPSGVHIYDIQIHDLLVEGENEILCVGEPDYFSTGTLSLMMIDSDGSVKWTGELNEWHAHDALIQGDRILVFTSDVNGTETAIYEIDKATGAVVQKHDYDSSLFTWGIARMLETGSGTILLFSGTMVYQLSDTWELSLLAELPPVGNVVPDRVHGVVVAGDGNIEICASQTGEVLLWYWITPGGELIDSYDSGLCLVNDYYSGGGEYGILVTLPYEYSPSDYDVHVNMRDLSSCPGESCCFLTTTTWLPACCASSEGLLIAAEGSDHLTVTGYQPTCTQEWQSEILMPLSDIDYVSATDIHNCGDGYVISCNIRLDQSEYCSAVVFTDSTGSSGYFSEEGSPVLTVLQNPFHDALTVIGEVQTVSSLSIQVFDMRGRLVCTQSADLEPGSYSVALEALPVGVLSVRTVLEDAEGASITESFRVTSL